MSEFPSPELDRLRRENAPDEANFWISAGNRVEEAAAGDTIELEPGTHLTPLEIDKPLVLRGAPGPRPILRGRPGDACVEITTDGEVVLEHLVLTGAGGTRGAVAALAMVGRLVLRDCLIFDNEQDGRGPGAGGVSIRGGTLVLERCVFFSNRGLLGGAVSLRGDARLEARSCVFAENVGVEGGGAVWAEDGARFRLLNCTFVDDRTENRANGAEIHVTGTLGRQAVGEIVNCVFGTRAGRDDVVFGYPQPPYSGRLLVRNSVVPPSVRDFPRATLGASTDVETTWLPDFPFAVPPGEFGWLGGDESAWAPHGDMRPPFPLNDVERELAMEMTYGALPEASCEALDLFGRPLIVAGLIGCGAVAPE